MKHIYTLLLGLLAWSASMAQEGVNFRDITFEEALKQAKSENKLVFMDCYTSWCGPCKNMADKVFPQKAAGDYFLTSSLQKPLFYNYLINRIL